MGSTQLVTWRRSFTWYDFRVAENAGDAQESYQRDTISNTVTVDTQGHQEQPSTFVTPPSHNSEMNSSTGSRIEVIDRGAVTNGDVANLQQLHHCSQELPVNSKAHSFYTRASISTPRGLVDFQRVQVDGRSSFNLLPWSTAIALNLVICSDSLRTTSADHPINQYCRLNIRVAGVETAINARVVPGLHIILLGRECYRRC
jgi:hypothetical protein